MSKENFKTFVRGHPELAQYVMNKKSSWQEFYELYDLYGEDNKVWDSYFNRSTIATPGNNLSTKENAMGELIKMVKNVDLKSVQKTVGNLQKTIGLLQDLGIGSSTATSSSVSSYEPRPMYRYFED